MNTPASAASVGSQQKDVVQPIDRLPTYTSKDNSKGKNVNVIAPSKKSRSRNYTCIYAGCEAKIRKNSTGMCALHWRLGPKVVHPQKSPANRGSSVPESAARKRSRKKPSASKTLLASTNNNTAAIGNGLSLEQQIMMGASSMICPGGVNSSSSNASSSMLMPLPNPFLNLPSPGQPPEALQLPTITVRDTPGQDGGLEHSISIDKTNNYSQSKVLMLNLPSPTRDIYREKAEQVRKMREVMAVPVLPKEAPPAAAAFDIQVDNIEPSRIPLSLAASEVLFWLGPGNEKRDDVK